ncbi:unnamed protein product [Closterium sp. NIES-64]|nr:unnamed protein product [Closterium sp. NIES-64]
MSLVLVLVAQLLSVRVATGYTHTSFHRHHRDGGRVGFNRITEARAAGDVEDTWDVLAGTPLPPGIGRLHREAREDAGEEGEDEVGEEWETGGEEEGEDEGGVEGEEEGKQGTVISHALEKKFFARGQLSEDSGRGREWGGYNRVHRQVGRWHAGKPWSGDFIKVGGSENTIDVGVRVVQNFVHDYGFAGIRCGADVRNQGDCMLGFIGYNYVYSRLRNMTGAADSAGIYYCTHWFNPGNRAECNYVKGGDHCYYLDYNTSGVKVIGGVCYDNWDGLKVNNGKFNRLKHVLVVNALKAPGWCTCLTPTVNNCNKFPGNYWENMRIKYYNTPVFKQRWPWFQTRVGH